MPPDTKPDDERIPRIDRLLKEYPEKIAAIKAPPAGAPPRAGGKDTLAALSEKLESLERRLAREIKEEDESLRKLAKKIESELAGVPDSRPQARRAAPPAAAESPGRRPAQKPAPGPAAPAPAPASGGADLSLFSPGSPAPPEEEAPAERGSRARTALAVLVLAAAAGAAWRYLAPAAPAHRVFPLPFPQGAGLAVQGRTLYSADPQRQLLFALSREDGQVISVQKFPNRLPAGLAAGDGCLWSSDRERIYKHGLDEDYPVLGSFAAPGRSPGALHWSGGSLWAGDSLSAAVSRYAAGEELVPLKQYALPGAPPSGICVSGNLLWVLEADANRITRYLPGDILTGADSLDLGVLTPPGSRTTAFAADGPDLFLLTENPAGLHRVDLTRLKSPAFRK